MPENEKFLTDYQEIITANLPEEVRSGIVVPELPHITVSTPMLAVVLAVREIQNGATVYTLMKHQAILNAVKTWYETLP